MATRPTGQPEWASNPSDPGDIVEPSAGRKEDGWNPSEKPPAQWFNWWMNLVYQWTDYFAAIIDSDEEHTYQTPKSRTIHIHPSQGFTSDGEGWYSIGTRVGTTQLEKEIDFDIGSHLPSGAELTAVYALVKPVLAPGSAPMKLAVYKTTVSPFTSGGTIPTSAQLGSTQNADGSNGHQAIALTGLTETIDRATTVYVARVSSSDSAGSGVGDLVYGVRLVFNDPGPRNA